jgi:hypothetical protein
VPPTGWGGLAAPPTGGLHDHAHQVHRDEAGICGCTRQRRATRYRGNPETSNSTATLDRLVRAQEDLAQEIRQLAAHQALEPSADHDDDTERAGRLLTVARTQLLEQLQEQEQEHSRRQLADAARNGEEAADGVVRGVTAIVRTIVPAALVRPEDLVDAAFTLADQGLRVSRRLALSISGSVRSPTA